MLVLGYLYCAICCTYLRYISTLHMAEAGATQLIDTPND